MIGRSKNFAIRLVSYCLFTHLFFSEANAEKTQNRLIISISQPCSLSVAFLRMMRERGDFLISHETGVPAWWISIFSGNATFYNHEPRSFPEVKTLIKKLVAQKNTFVKEESYAAVKYLHDFDLITSPETYTVFLLRNPHHVLLSIYSKWPPKPIRRNFIFDYAAMWNLFTTLKSKASHTPLIINTDDLLKDPSSIVQQFCSYAKIPFKEESLHWEDLSKNFGYHNFWWDTPYARFDKIWHGNALASTGFVESNKVYAVDSNGEPTFEEIADHTLRANYLQLYKEAIPFYQLFLDEYDKQSKDY